MLKGGETGPAIVRGDSEKSLLYRIVAGKEETVMPPKKNKVGAAPLNKEQVQKLKLWIDQGAAGSTAPLVLNNQPIKWRPLPPGRGNSQRIASTYF